MCHFPSEISCKSNFFASQNRNIHPCHCIISFFAFNSVVTKASVLSTYELHQILAVKYEASVRATVTLLLAAVSSEKSGRLKHSSLNKQRRQWL